MHIKYVAGTIMHRIILLMYIFFPACSSKEETTPPAPSKDIKLFASIISKYSVLPSKIVEADFVEFQKGDGVLGSSDFAFYARFKVNVSELPKWTDSLREQEGNIIHDFPSPDLNWWLSKDKCETLNIHEAKKYFGCFNGWLTADEKTGYIYAYTFTM